MTHKGRKTKSAAPSKVKVLVALVALVAAVAVGALVAVALGGGEEGGVRFSDVHGIAVNPERPEELYVATHHGLVRGVDDGSWAHVGDVRDDLMGFTVHPTNGSVMWVSGHPSRGGNMGVRLTTDGGLTWETIALAGQVDFHAMTVSPADPQNLWGYHGRQIHRSTDGGHNWETLPGAPGPIRGLAGDPREGDTVYAATERGVAVSRDGGLSWAAWKEGPTAAVVLDPETDGVAYAAGPGGVERTADGGLTWSRLGLDVGGETPGYLAIHPEDPRVLYVATYQTGIYKTIDAGDTWSQVNRASR